MLAKISLPVAGVAMFAWFIYPQMVALWVGVETKVSAAMNLGAF